MCLKKLKILRMSQDCLKRKIMFVWVLHMKKLPEKRPSALCPINDVSAEHCKLAESLVSEINEPSSIKEAWHNEYGKQWMIATDSEFESLIEANN